MASHSHDFVEQYDGMAAFGYDRKTDEKTIIYYLQKFSDDTLMKHLAPRMSDGELEELFVLVNRCLKKHLSDDEYHSLFLKDEHHHH